jgi:ABC-type multidrug transport system fused ATPase/permease subunit
MDEAVSSLDAESERALRQAMDTVRRDHATLVIAHRLSTIRTADRVVLLADGRVVDSGPHDHLLDRCPDYGDLLATQQDR